MSQDLNDYKDNIFPLMCRDINTLFPNMNFHLNRRGDKLVSNHHFNGQKDSQGQIVVNIDLSKPYSAYDLARGEAKNLINWYMEENRLDFFSALDEIADKCNTPRYERTQRSEESRRIQENRSNALDLFIKNLWSDRPEAKRVLDYLHFRKWTNDEIKKAELGLITPDLRESLPDADSYFIKTGQDYKDRVGETHLLTIPYRTASTIKGFKFRYSGEGEPSNKYINSRDLHKGESLFGVRIGVKDIVIVEGELDALHAQVRGANYVVATTGNGISYTQAQDAIKRGVSKFTLLYDNDPQGHGFISPSIEILEGMGAEVFIAYIPNEENPETGKQVKDLDEYLSLHPEIKDLDTIRREAIYSHDYQYKELIKEYSKQSPLRDKPTIDLLDGIDKILSSPYLKKRPYLMEIIYSQLPNDLSGLGIDSNLFTSYMKDKKDKEIEENRIRELQEKTLQIKNLLDKGKREEATSLMREIVGEQEEETDSERYARLLEDDLDSLLDSMRNQPPGIRTNIELTQPGENNNTTYRFYLPSGAITLICAPTGHGKSKMLISLALDTLSDDEEGTILYITYEENKESVYRQMINAFADLDITAQTAKHGNAQTIEEYFRTGDTTYMRGNTIQPFKDKVEEFNNLYRQRRIILIRPGDNLSTTLKGFLNYSHSNIKKIRGIFVDYVQELYLPDAKAKVRADELKQIMVELDQIAQETALPVIMGAQLKRETKSPLTMSNQDIADSGWIERKASEILLLWSNKEKVKNDTETGKYAKEVERDLSSLELGTKGKIYLKLTKSRVIPTGIHAILNINGNTGRIQFNATGEEKKESSTEEKKLPF